MKSLRSLVAVVAISAVSFGVALAHGGDKACCKDKTTASKSGDKCADKCTPKTAKAKKADAAKTEETAKKS
jgi:hypothetical protein